MQSDAQTPKDYLESLEPDRRRVIRKLRTHIRRGLPKGFAEVMSYGMLGYVVPLRIYPAGYHCKKETPLPFINLASQKHHVAVYHMGLYADSKLLTWFNRAYQDTVGAKPDLGKCCIRFRKFDELPYALIEELAAKMSPAEWIKHYESSINR